MLTIDQVDYSITLDRGDDGEIEFTIVDRNGNLLDVSAGSFRLTVKASVDDAIGAAIFQLTQPTVNGIDLTDAAVGIVVARIPHLYVENLAGEYLFDLEMTLAGKVTTVWPPEGGAALLRVPKDVSTPGSVTNPTAPGQTLSGFLAQGGANYYQDQVTGQWWKVIFENGAENTYGPSATVPF